MAIVECWDYTITTGGIQPGRSIGWTFGIFPWSGRAIHATAHMPYSFSYKSCTVRDERVELQPGGSNQQFFMVTLANTGDAAFNDIYLTLSSIRR
ncbi:MULTISPECIES: hypothetical protein [Streptomyces]|uniref:hypothetical protein n=1 Tax=Streptomyces TaxID=1883 RepID=UPI000A895DD6|nr:MULTISPECIES: hypothetical protein [Streptomyces]